MTPARSTDAAPKHGLYLQNAAGYIDDLARPEIMVEYATAAEDAGWDGVFMADGLYPSFNSVEPWITLSAIAARTESVTLGTWITPVPRRLPWQLAHDLATLDHLSGGRVMLGAGLGVEENYTTFGESWDPPHIGRRYDEALELIDALWRGETVTHDGECFTVEGAELPLPPVQEPRIPIVLGGWWPNEKPFRRAAEWDGIMPASPGFYGQEGEQGEPVTGSAEAELREMLAFYRDVADDPGEILLPIDVPEAGPDFADVCRELGATWLLTTSLLAPDDHEGNLERIREGPPA